jgi:hypothetical protein
MSSLESPIYVKNEAGEFKPSQFTVADARRNKYRAAVLVIRQLGIDYWANQAPVVGEDVAGNTTLDGLSEDEYIRDYILSVEEDTG